MQTWNSSSIDFLATNDCHNDDHGIIADCWTESMKGNASMFPALWTPTPNSRDCHYNLIETAFGLTKLPDCAKNNIGPDCDYDMTEKEVKLPRKDSIQVMMEIQQSKCLSGTLLEGGASFNALAHNDKYIVSCGAIDLFDNNYVISCVLPKPQNPKTPKPHIYENKNFGKQKYIIKQYIYFS